MALELAVKARFGVCSVWERNWVVACGGFMFTIG